MRGRLAATASAVLFRTGHKVVNLGYRICPPPTPEPTAKDMAFQRWREVNGDKTLRLEYELDRRSLVLDVGGYEGQWASDIFSRYLCAIHVFEPVPDFADAIERRFASNDAIKLHRVALGAKAGEAKLSISGDGSSLHLQTDKEVLVRVVTLEEIVAAEGIDDIALMKINIEGAEYDLLDHLTASGLVRRVRNLQVQFHDFVQDAECRKKAIQSRLRETHKLTYEYPFVWESWERV
jgi:FkbM family methyltransferase